MKRWIIGAVVLIVAVVIGGPFAYFQFIEGKAPPKLSLATTAVPTTVAGTADVPLAGIWKVATGSVVRYRVKETLLGQSATAVGTTNSVTGSLTISGKQLTKAAFTVDMTTVKSDRSQRDSQFQGRIMNTARFPTGTFTLSKLVELAPVPKDGVIATYSATGKLTLHGTTREVTLELSTRRTGNVLQVQGSTPITFSDYGIGNPSAGPASVGNSGLLEFVLQFQPN